MGLVEQTRTRETRARIGISRTEGTVDCFKIPNEGVNNALWTVPEIDDTFNLRRTRPWGVVAGFMVPSQFVDKMDQNVIQKFSQFSQVTLITRSDKADYINFNIYTPNLEFDRLLSETLIGQEIEIMDLYPDEIFDFRLRTFNPEVQKDPNLFEDEKVIYPHGRLQFSPSTSRT